MPEESPHYGLLGRTLGHSWSARIHAHFGSVPYDLIELEPDELSAFIKQGNWQGLNVTIPYKREAFLLADKATPNAQRLGVANTLTKDADGTIVADNTDVLGFAWMLERFCAKHYSSTAREAFAHKDVLVLGSGGASKAVCCALLDIGAHVQVISREKPGYDQLAQRFPHTALIVNTTPVGMYPHCPQSLLSKDELAELSELKGILDVVYNPVRTGLCLAAEALGIAYESGLAMLVGQARFSSEAFQHTSISQETVLNCLKSLAAETENIVLIGMPGVGKTSAGKILAHLMGRPFVDLDEAITLDKGKSPAELIQTQGEAAFRAIESRVAAHYGARSGLVIACGGGIVTTKQNYAFLHQNGRIVFLERDLSTLSTAHRPLSQQQGLDKLAAHRMPFYTSWADMRLHCTGSAAGDAAAILAHLKAESL